MKLFLDWSSYQDAGMGDAYADIPKSGGNFAKAVAVCINSGQCETTGRGVMCPSYRVSENSELSTGGRVKMLKAALNGEFGKEGFDHQPLMNAMDLCVSCKGCKRECENEVDMALIKAEYLAQHHQRHGLPLRNRLFASVPKLLADFPRFQTLIKWRNRSSLLRRIGEKFLGIAAEMNLAEPAKTPFNLTNTNQTAGKEQLEQVVLFVDSFNRFFNPAAAEAAVAVLSKAGYQVEILEAAEPNAKPLCCGRTYFANGMIEQAREQAQRLLSALQPHLQAGRRVIGLEPSCILSLRDEYLYLGLGETATNLANNVLLFEEFIAKEHTAKRWHLSFQALQENQYLVHGHCHQKAVGATKSMRKVLKLIPGLQSTLIESSCCGMAGQFGYEAEHINYAKEMAEQGLFPSLRKEPHAKVIANGFSCQQQIINGGFDKPVHIAELLHAALTES